MTLAEQITNMGRAARAASRILGVALPETRNRALLVLADLIEARSAAILDANNKDMEAARAAAMDGPRLARLRITPAIIAEMSTACRDVAAQLDPVGAMESQWRRPNGLLVGKMRVPLGVVAMIFESRPNVTIEASIMCLKSGNAVILRGGSEALHSNLRLAGLIHEALAEASLPADCVQVVPVPDREAVRLLCALDQYVDVMIPRGGEPLIRAVTEAATMPVLKHYKGVCHAFIDSDADLDAAVEIVFNSKVQRPSACNSLECLLVHKEVAQNFLPKIGARLGAAGVEFRACAQSLPLLGSTAKPLADGDFGTEFLDLILAVKVLDSTENALDEALAHIAKYGSNHTEIICTNNHAHAMRFTQAADASMVAVNASTRFNDGGQLGLGAEIGISTSKLHAYGPMGVKELTTTKFVVFGEGQARK